MEAEPEVMELYDLPFSDLLRLSSNSALPSPTNGDQSRLECISASIMEALGPSGPGLLSISGVPFASSLRRSLLPLALHLSLLNPKDRASLLKRHGLGSDVPLKKPDRSVSSFASLLKYQGESVLDQVQDIDFTSNSEELAHNFGLSEHNDSEFDHLGDTFEKLGRCMMELGVRLARVCDNAMRITELEKSIIHSGSAKGRLIHYHSMLDGLILKEAIKRVGLKNRSKKSPAFNEICKEKSTVADLWQQWHYDYGIFTVLTSPLFLSSTVEGEHLVSKESLPPMGHSCLQLFDNRKKRIVSVKCQPDSFIIQVGEAADVLSGGKLRSTLHAVCKPMGLTGDVSRETFVVFLQPSWDKVLHCHGFSLDPDEEVRSGDELADIHSKIPPLSARLRDGMTFAEFSRETTKQYYGGSGIQSKR
ncbi:2-oxoglutarate (2OG) and Fe(II)-dependent oxygenase superfamily protein [Rhynchospora pubera]|uniref:2-oxoglutarate (2OG) and Fe(II)-dependent oxygenase superfamily protein n=1 Tax=Rhynchospora pubera TaxID=906938 RepID=A0AAV8FRC1_9POAL|nr:2-oxoglutarate (2OG) and Fe(II)-dependent oxygenase superfamily protein [Rhynchospora pubera]